MRVFFKRTLPGLVATRMSDGASAPEAPSQLFRDWQRISTQTSVKANAHDSKWMYGSAPKQEPPDALRKDLSEIKQSAPSVSETEILVFS